MTDKQQSHIFALPSCSEQHHTMYRSL